MNQPKTLIIKQLELSNPSLEITYLAKIDLPNLDEGVIIAKQDFKSKSATHTK